MPKAIVTGGAVRIGKAISLALADAGYDIILIFKGSFDEAKDIIKLIEAKNKKCFLHRCDLSKKEKVDALFAEISIKYDDIEMLVNNASIFKKYSFMETSEQIFDDHMNINFKAPFFLTQNFARYVNKREYILSANVVNILDGRINGIHTGHFIYHLTKKSLNEFTKMAAKELAPKIRVNGIALGAVLPTRISDEQTDIAKYPKLKEVTDAVVKLSSSNDLNGHNIIIESDPDIL